MMADMNGWTDGLMDGGTDRRRLHTEIGMRRRRRKQMSEEWMG